MFHILSQIEDKYSLPKRKGGGINLNSQGLISQFETWAEEVLTEYNRLLRVSKQDANSKTSEFVLSIQQKHQQLANGLRDIVLGLYPNYRAIPYTHIMHAILLPVLMNCVRDIDDPKVDEHLYSGFVDDVRFLLNLKLDKNRAWVYLHQFGCLRDHIDLDGPLRIRKATLIELYIFQITNQSVGGRTRCQFVAETTSDTSFLKIEGNRVQIDNAQVLEDFRTLVTALRITSPSSIGLNTVTLVCNLFAGSTIVTMNVPAIMQFNPAPEIFPGAFSHFVNTQCIIDKHEVELFQKLYKRLREIYAKEGKLREQIQRALRRYNVALISDQSEDSIVDAVIALEILFKAGGFKMAFRASLFSGIDSKERQLIVQTLEKCHRVRSEIVHGSSSKKPEYEQLMEKLIVIACRVFRTYLYATSIEADIISLVKSIAYDSEQLANFQQKIAEWSQAETSWIWKPTESLVDMWNVSVAE